jgi:hypothetical protein
MLVMRNGVSLKHALERRSAHTQVVLSVHQLPVYLVLDKRHQNAGEDEPGADVQDKHHRSSNYPAEKGGRTPFRGNHGFRIPSTWT